MKINLSSLIFIGVLFANVLAFMIIDNASAVYYSRSEIEAIVKDSGQNVSSQAIDNWYNEQKTIPELREAYPEYPEDAINSMYKSQDVMKSFKEANSSSVTNCESRFLGFPAWYRGLTDDDCSIKSPNDAGLSLGDYIWRIVMNVIEAVSMLITYASVGFILYGGFLYMTSQGSSDSVNKAKATITNAIIGLVLSILAIAIINFIFAGIGI